MLDSPKFQQHRKYDLLKSTHLVGFLANLLVRGLPQVLQRFSALAIAAGLLAYVHLCVDFLSAPRAVSTISI